LPLKIEVLDKYDMTFILHFKNEQPSYFRGKLIF